jgi:CHASE2 domain-containing sensor protein
MTVRKGLSALAMRAVATAIAWAAGSLPLVNMLEWKLYDQRVRWAANPTMARQDIVMVTIDESSVRLIEPQVGRWPSPESCTPTSSISSPRPAAGASWSDPATSPL